MARSNQLPAPASTAISTARPFEPFFLASGQGIDRERFSTRPGYCGNTGPEPGDRQPLRRRAAREFCGVGREGGADAQAAVSRPQTSERNLRWRISGRSTLCLLLAADELRDRHLGALPVGSADAHESRIDSGHDMSVCGYAVADAAIWPRRQDAEFSPHRFVRSIRRLSHAHWAPCTCNSNTHRQSRATPEALFQMPGNRQRIRQRDHHPQSGFGQAASRRDRTARCNTPFSLIRTAFTRRWS